MNEPGPWPPPQKPRPLWVTVLIVVLTLVGLAILAVVTVVGLILYSCSRH